MIHFKNLLNNTDALSDTETLRSVRQGGEQCESMEGAGVTLQTLSHQSRATAPRPTELLILPDSDECPLQGPCHCF